MSSECVAEDTHFRFEMSFTSLILFLRYDKPSFDRLLKVPPNVTDSGITLKASPPFTKVIDST